MSQKNYYQVLHVSPQATAAEIKTAYRKLAVKYHPDKNKGNTFTESIFKEINEAYSVLSNPQKRILYNAAGTFATPPKRSQQQRVVSSQTLLQEAFRVKMIVEKSSMLRINRDALLFKVQALLSDHHLNILLLENNKHFIHQYVQQVMICLQPLSFQSIQPFLQQLNKLATTDKAMLQRIDAFYKAKKEDDLWHRYKFFIVLAIAIFLCCLMYIMYS